MIPPPQASSRPVLTALSAATGLLLLMLLCHGPTCVVADCKYFHVNATQPFVMREFQFLAYTTGCVNVKVYWSGTEPGPDEVTIGTLDPEKWNMMCDSDVYGQGIAGYTTLPASDCTPVAASAGDEIWFYFGIEEYVDDGSGTVACADGSGAGGNTYQSLTKNYTTWYDFCPANNTATLDENPFGGISPPITPTTQSPTKRPSTSIPTYSPTARPTDMPVPAGTPTTARPSAPQPSHKPTYKTYTLTTSSTPGGYVDPPQNETEVHEGRSITMSFYPEICLEVDKVATGILYGHFDADYMQGFDTLEFPITYTPGTGVYGVDWGARTGKTGSFSYPTSTDAHDHEYDEDCDCVYVDYFRPSASMVRMDTIIEENAVDVGKNYLDMVFKVIAINGDINTAGFITINQLFEDSDINTYHSVVTWDDKTVDELDMYTFGNPNDPTWNPNMQSPLREKVIQITEMSLGYKKDAIRRGPGGILPTNTGDMRGNIPGQYGEWRNGALTVQVVEVDPVDGSFHCYMMPEWSNASAYYECENKPDPLPRSPQGPIYDCDPGYNVLFEGTLFWHWSGSCNGGSSSYHGAEWEDDYHAFFTSDCRGVDEFGNACVLHEFCYVLVDGVPACTKNGQLTISNFNTNTFVEAIFAEMGECPTPPPTTAAPSVSSAPTISFSPTYSPTVSHQPTINAFKKDVIAALSDPSNIGRCWRYAHTWSCHPSTDTGMPTCSYVEDAQADSVSANSAYSNDACCPTEGWTSHEDAWPECINFHVMGPASSSDGCLDAGTTLSSTGIVTTGATLSFPDGGSYANAFAVNISVAEDHICSSCFLSMAQSFSYDATQGIAPMNRCPGEGGNRPWADYNSRKIISFTGKLAKHYTFVYTSSKYFPYAFGANIFCGPVEGETCARILPADANKKDRGYKEVK